MPFNIKSPDDIIVYRYEHIDDLSFIRNSESVTNDHILFSHGIDAEHRNTVEKFVRVKLISEGWEGDGELGLIWIPPFIFKDSDTYGEYVWHVKQNNNGTSWIASTRHLPFKELLRQNKVEPQGTPVHILFSECRLARTCIRDTFKQVISHLEYLSSFATNHDSLQLESVILEHAYCYLVQQFQHFLDDCYLVLLKESLQNGNYYKIKLRLPKTKFSFDTDGIDTPHMLDEQSENWLIKNQIISSIWKAFQFESFNEKIANIPSSVGLRWDPAIVKYLKKAVAVRNCFQHHSGQLHQDVLKTIDSGATSINMKNNEGTYQVNKWDFLTIHKHEFICLYWHSMLAITTLGVHINKNINKRYYYTEDYVTETRLFD